LPAPVRPIIPTFSPGLISKVRPLRTRGKSGRYRSWTSLKETAPTVGQISLGFGSS
jgi:hypothetical protein